MRSNGNRSIDKIIVGLLHVFYLLVQINIDIERSAELISALKNNRLRSLAFSPAAALACVTPLIAGTSVGYATVRVDYEKNKRVRKFQKYVKKQNVDSNRRVCTVDLIMPKCGKTDAQSMLTDMKRISGQEGARML